MITYFPALARLCIRFKCLDKEVLCLPFCSFVCIAARENSFTIFESYMDIFSDFIRVFSAYIHLNFVCVIVCQRKSCNQGGLLVCGDTAPSSETSFNNQNLPGKLSSYLGSTESTHRMKYS